MPEWKMNLLHKSMVELLKPLNDVEVQVLNYPEEEGKCGCSFQFLACMVVTSVRGKICHA